jgi:hypothetical protein
MTLDDILLALEVVGGVLLDAREATSDELLIMNDVVCLRGEHGLYVVLTVAHDEAVSVSSLGRWRHLLYLQALHYRDGEELCSFVGIIEDGAAEVSISIKTLVRRFSINLLQGPLG